MKPYPAYKPTNGIFWNITIPHNWHLKRIGSVFIQRNEKVSDTDYEPLSVTKQGIFKQLEFVAKSDAHDDRKLVKKDDFVINSRSDRRGSSGISNWDGSVSLINTVLIPSREIIPKYTEYLLKSYEFINEFYRHGHGIVADLWTTNFSLMKNIFICIPTETEQKQIVSFLDSMTQKIDELIQKTEQKIELLKEKRTSLINHCVTKGLNPNVEMKDSGVEWIGEIPVEWEKKRNKDLLYETKKIVGDSWKDFKLLSLSKKGIILRDIESGFGKFPSSFETYQTVKKDDLIFCLYDIDETPRTIGISNLNGMITSSYKIIKCKSNIHPKFIYYIYLTIDTFKGLRPYYTGLRNVVRTETFMSLPIYTPKYQEQTQIVEYLDEQTQKIDSIVEKETKRIELLKEYRQALISEVVTGKIDVRNWNE